MNRSMTWRITLTVAVALVAGCSAAGSTSTGSTSTGSTSTGSTSTGSTSTGSTSTSSTSTATSTVPTAATASRSQAPVAAESNPPGDIPDNLAFVAYANATGHYRLTHPEGWLQQEAGSTVVFTDKLNGVEVMRGAATAPPTVASARATGVPALARSQAAFELMDVSIATVRAGSGVRIVYRRNSAPDDVTGRQYRDEVVRYELVHGGHQVVVELFGPVGADNVDAYRTMIQSLRFS